MKYISKIARFAALTLSAVSLLSSCEKDGDTLCVYPDKAPVLSIDKDVLKLDESKADDKAVQLSWTKADFLNNEVSITYDIILSASDKEVTLATETGLERTFTQKYLNTKSKDLNLKAGEESEVTLHLVAMLVTSEGKRYELNKYNSIKSNIVKLKLTPYEITKPIPDSEKTGIGIVGDAARGWPSGDDDFEKDVMLDPVKGKPHLWKRENVELIGGKIFKFRKDHSWNKGGNWGRKDKDTPQPFPKGTLVNDGGSQDLKVTDPKGGIYTVTFNDETGEFEFVRTGDLNNQPTPEPTPTLKKGVSLIGTAVGGWETANDLMLTKDAKNEHLWTAKGIEIKEGNFKFRLDQKWETSWGKGKDGSDFPKGKTEVNGGNFKVPADKAGLYDVTFNDETGEFEFTKAEKPKTVIGIVGDGANGWGDNDDVILTQDPKNEHIWTGKITLIGGKSVKFRKDHKWDVNWGAKDFPKGTGTQGGDNIAIPTDKGGEYTVTLNDETGEYNFTLIKGTSPKPTPQLKKGVSLIGTAVGGWETANDLMLTKDASNEHLWTAKGVDMKAGEFKFRLDQAWGTSWGKGKDGSDFPKGKTEVNGGNLKVPADKAGLYDVTFNDETGEFNFTKPQAKKVVIGIVGDGANGWGDKDDVILTQDPKNEHLFTGKLTLIGGKSVKFRKDHKWDTNWGNDNSDFPKGTGTQGGANIAIPADKGGEYSVTFNDETGEYNFTLIKGTSPKPTPQLKKGVSLIGTALGGWETANDLMLTKDASNEHLWTAKGVDMKAGEFKFRLDQAWGTSWGKGDDGSDFPKGTSKVNAGNLNVPADKAGVYDVTFNDQTGAFTFVAEGKKLPKPNYEIGIIGSAVKGWGTDVMLTPSETVEHEWTGEVELHASENGTAKQFKFRKDKKWSKPTGNWGGANATFPKGTAIDQSNDGIKVPEGASGTYIVTFNDATGAYSFKKK